MILSEFKDMLIAKLVEENAKYELSLSIMNVEHRTGYEEYLFIGLKNLKSKRTYGIHARVTPADHGCSHDYRINSGGDDGVVKKFFQHDFINKEIHLILADIDKMRDELEYLEKKMKTLKGK